MRRDILLGMILAAGGLLAVAATLHMSMQKVEQGQA